MLVNSPTTTDLTLAPHTHLNTANGGATTHGIIHQAQHYIYNPSASTTYYWGSLVALAPKTTAQLARVYVPVACTLRYVYLWTVTAGTLATSEDSTLYIRQNNTTDILVTNGLKHAQPYSVIGNRNVAQTSFAAGDYWEFKIVHPAWVTSPTTIVSSSTVYFSTP